MGKGRRNSYGTKSEVVAQQAAFGRSRRTQARRLYFFGKAILGPGRPHEIHVEQRHSRLTAPPEDAEP